MSRQTKTRLKGRQKLTYTLVRYKSSLAEFKGDLISNIERRKWYKTVTQDNKEGKPDRPECERESITLQGPAD